MDEDCNARRLKMKKHGYTSLNHDFSSTSRLPKIRRLAVARDRTGYELRAGRLLGMAERSALSSREYEDCSEKLSPIACTTDVFHARASRLELVTQVSNHHDLSLCCMADHIWTFPPP